MTTCFTADPGCRCHHHDRRHPALGSLAINSFVLHGTEPLLVDTGTVAGGAEFMAALDLGDRPGQLRWIWLTHTDFDHIGSLATLLEVEPRAAGHHVLPRRRHHGPVLDPAADGPRPSRQPGPDRDGRRPPADRHQAARLRQPDHHRLRRRPHRSPVQLRLLRRAAPRRARRRAGSRRRRAARRARSAGPRSTRPGCTTSTATPSAPLDRLRAHPAVHGMQQPSPARPGTMLDLFVDSLAHGARRRPASTAPTRPPSKRCSPAWSTPPPEPGPTPDPSLQAVNPFGRTFRRRLHPARHRRHHHQVRQNTSVTHASQPAVGGRAAGRYWPDNMGQVPAPDCRSGQRRPVVGGAFGFAQSVPSGAQIESIRECGAQRASLDRC